MSGQLELNCLVLDDEPRHIDIFPVKISSVDNVSALRELVKEKKPHTFQHLDANYLVLWEVSISADSESDSDLQDKLKDLVLDDTNQLMPLTGLAQVFSNINEEGLHVVIRAPTGECPEIWVNVSHHLSSAPLLLSAATSP